MVTLDTRCNAARGKSTYFQSYDPKLNLDLGGIGTPILLISVPMFLTPFSRFRNFLFLRVPDVAFKCNKIKCQQTLWFWPDILIIRLHCWISYIILCSGGISHLFYFKNWRMYKPLYLKYYLQFSEAIFQWDRYV